MPKLKSCPLCGETQGLEVHLFENGYGVSCPNCGALGSLDYGKQKAIQKRNSRIQEAPEMSQERPQIIDKYNARNFICPFRDTSRDEGCSSLCMMWVSVGINKGRCGLVNTIYGRTGCGDV